MIGQRRLSLTPSPFMGADTTGSTLFYTDGQAVNQADMSTLPIGVYDVAYSLGLLSFSPFNPEIRDQTYIGSISVSVAGQLTCDAGLGYDRKWEIYNAANQRPLLLSVISQERGITPCPTNSAWQPLFLNPLNRGSIMLGEPSRVEVEYMQAGFLDTLYGGYAMLNGIAWNGDGVNWTAAQRGTSGGGTDDTNYCARGVRMLALYSDPAAIGLNMATMCILAGVHSAARRSAIYSAPVDPPLDDDGVMYIKWMG